MYKVELTRNAEKELARVYRFDKSLYHKLIYALDSLQKEPYLGKKLVGEANGLWSFRIGTYRIIYLVQKQTLMVVVIDIGHRRDIYSRLQSVGAHCNVPLHATLRREYCSGGRPRPHRAQGC